MRIQHLFSLQKRCLTSSVCALSSHSIIASKYHCVATTNKIDNILHAKQGINQSNTLSNLKYNQLTIHQFSTNVNSRNIIHDDDTTYATNNKNLKEVVEEEPIIGGADLIQPTLSSNNRKKVIFDGHLPSGYDVLNVELPPGKTFPEASANNRQEENENTVHYTSSVIAFEDVVYLWNVKTIDDVTKESLRLVTMYEPKIELVFIGSNTPLSYRDIGKIQKHFKKYEISVEQLTISNAMATFNMLNSEDRKVAVALVLDPEDKE